MVGPVTPHAFAQQYAKGGSGWSVAAQPARPAPPPSRPPTHVPPQLAPAVEAARARAQNMPGPQGGARPISALRPSAEPRRIIYDHEAQANVSNRLHWPQGASGVTLGPGYDMRERSAATIKADLMQVGVQQAAAETVSAAATLRDSAASNFVKRNIDVVNLRRREEKRLLIVILPQGQSKESAAVRAELHQHEYDAMNSYAYNPGAGWRRVTLFVNERRHREAMEELRRHVTSKGKVVRSLVRRRQAETRMFLYEEYRWKRQVVFLQPLGFTRQQRAHRLWWLARQVRLHLLKPRQARRSSRRARTLQTPFARLRSRSRRRPLFKLPPQLRWTRRRLLARIMRPCTRRLAKTWSASPA